MIWPFRRRRRPAKPQHIGPEAVTWQAGDVAECIACDRTQIAADPKKGGKYIVRGVMYGESIDGSVSAFGLLLCGFNECGYYVRAFRKVVPTFEEQKREDRAPAPTRVPA